MSATMTNPLSSANLLSTDLPVRMAKAGVRKTNPSMRALLGRCVEEVRLACGLNLDEFAHALGKNPRQVARWISGEDNPMFDAIVAVERFRSPLVIALASLSKDIEVVTEIRVRRSA